MASCNTKREHLPKAGFPQGKQNNYFVAIKVIPRCFLPISRTLIILRGANSSKMCEAHTGGKIASCTREAAQGFLAAHGGGSLCCQGPVAFRGITPCVVQTQVTQDGMCHSHQHCTIPSPVSYTVLSQVQENTFWGEGKDLLSSFSLQLGLAAACRFLSKAQKAAAA